MTEVKSWLKYAGLAVVFLLVGMFGFPNTITVEDTDRIDILTLDNEGLKTDLEAEQASSLEYSEALSVAEQDLLDEKNAHAVTTSDLEALREVPLEAFDFADWIAGLFAEAEDDADLEYDGEVYEGDDGEWDFEEVDSDSCELRWSDDDFTEGTLECEDVEVETDDDDNLVCDFEFEIEDGIEYDDVEISNCVLD